MYRRTFVLAVGTLLTLPSLAHANQFETAVIEMVEKASSVLTRLGLNDAVRNADKDTWVNAHNSLYVFIFDGTGLLLVHPVDRMVGINIRRSSDASGKMFIEKILNDLNDPGDTTWTSYYWSDPADGHVRQKRVYSKRVGDLIVNCGYYLDQA